MIQRYLTAHVRALKLLPLLAASLAAGCSSEPAPRSDSSVGTSYDALAAKLKDCERAKRECIDASACEAGPLAVCEDDFKACREAARVEEDALHAATHACRTAEETCRENAADEAADKACHEQHETCMRASRPPEPPCHAALRTCLDDARDNPTEPDADADGGVPEYSADGDDAGAEPGPGRGPGHEPPPACATPPEPPAPKLPPPPPDETLPPAPKLPPPPDAMPPGPPPPGMRPHCAKPHAPKMPHHPRPESAAEAACHDQARACMMTEMESEPAPGEHLHCPPPPPPAPGDGPLPPVAGAAGTREPPPPPPPTAGAPAAP